MYIRVVLSGQQWPPESRPDAARRLKERVTAVLVGRYPSADIKVVIGQQDSVIVVADVTEASIARIVATEAERLKIES